MVALLTELLPVVLGTGEQARLDWSLAYISLRFIILPAISLMLIVWIVCGLFSIHRQRERLIVASAIVFPTAYLVLLWLHPFSFFV